MITLSEKERAIIELKAQGKTVNEIARRLLTSKRYAHQMIHDLYAKTGSRNSGSLVAWGYKNHVLQINAENLPI